MKTLLIKYLPAGEKSNTVKILNMFLDAIKNHNLETVDLIKTDIPIFDYDTLPIYFKKHYGGQDLTEDELNKFQPFYKLVTQFKSADIIVMAYPMYNFGMPGIVKSYFDAVMLNGVTFDLDKKIMLGKKSLSFFTSGALHSTDQDTSDYPHWDTLTMLAKINFKFMGFDEVEVMSAHLNDPTTAAGKLAEIEAKIAILTKRWYSGKQTG